jgi:hypothetical protein
MPPQAAKTFCTTPYSLDGDIFFMISLREISKIMSLSKDKSARSAKLSFERHVIFTISLREIVKMTCLSEEYSAAEGGKRLFAQPLILWRLAPNYVLTDTSFCDFALRNRKMTCLSK